MVFPSRVPDTVMVMGMFAPTEVFDAMVMVMTPVLVFTDEENPEGIVPTEIEESESAVVPYHIVAVVCNCICDAVLPSELTDTPSSSLSRSTDTILAPLPSSPLKAMAQE